MWEHSCVDCVQCSWWDDCFCYGHLHIVSKGILAIIPVIGVWLVLQCLESVQVVKRDCFALLRGCCCTPYQKQGVLLRRSRSPGVSDSVALRYIPCPKGGNWLQRMRSVQSQRTFEPPAGVCSSAQKQPQGHVPFFVLFVPDLVHSYDVKLPRLGLEVSWLLKLR